MPWSKLVEKDAARLARQYGNYLNVLDMSQLRLALPSKARA